VPAIGFLVYEGLQHDNMKVPRIGADVSFLLGLAGVIGGIGFFILGHYEWAAINVVAGIANFWVTFRDKPGAGHSEEYSEMIERLADMGEQLAALGPFLKREQQRIAETENTIKALQDQQSELEPLVATHRETVEAILTAHARQVRTNVWKDRVAGFGLGVLASLFATLIFEYFSGSN